MTAAVPGAAAAPVDNALTPVPLPAAYGCICMSSSMGIMLCFM